MSTIKRVKEWECTWVWNFLGWPFFLGVYLIFGLELVVESIKYWQNIHILCVSQSILQFRPISENLCWLKYIGWKSRENSRHSTCFYWFMLSLYLRTFCTLLMDTPTLNYARVLLPLECNTLRMRNTFYLT